MNDPLAKLIIGRVLICCVVYSAVTRSVWQRPFAHSIPDIFADTFAVIFADAFANACTDIFADICTDTYGTEFISFVTFS